MQDAAEQARLSRLYDALRERLLDLSRRNPMLSYKLGPRGRRHLSVVDEVPEEVYRRLVAEEKRLDLAALPEPEGIPADERTEEFQAALAHARVSDVEHLTKLEALDAAARDDEHALARLDRELRDRVRGQLGLPPRPDLESLDLNAHARENGIDPSIDLPAVRSREEHGDGKLQALLLPDDLEARLEKIADAARLAEGEMGLSTLFLALGFLEWYESDDAERPSFAPLLLLPVRLEVRRVRGRKVFSLAASGDGADHNVTLQKFLEKTRGRRLPDFSGDPEAEGAVEAYFRAVGEAVEGLKRWRVRRFLVLGHFAFGRLAMYEDLNPESWSGSPASRPLVEAILRGTDGAGEASLAPLPEDYPIDDPEVEAQAPILVHDADASQHSAVIDAMRGTNLVIEGPPGTGKSQTITNVIANALAKGKTVLFLAEKLAALEVVKRRLDAAGLGEFCLELHSDKASAKQVVERLKARAALRPGATATPRLDARGWSEARRAIAAYLDALHEPRADGDSAFSLIWRSVASRDDLGGALDAFRGAALPENLLERSDEARAALARLVLHAEAARAFEGQFGPFRASPWRDVAFRGTQAYAAREVLDGIEEAARSLGLAREAAAALAAPSPGSDGEEALPALPTLDAMVAGLAALPDPPDLAGIDAVAGVDPGELAASARDLRSLLLLEAGLDQQAREGGLELASVPDGALEVAASVRQGLDPDLARLTPVEAYRAAVARIEEAEALAPLIEAFRPALDLLGLHRAPVAAARAASVAAQVAGALEEGLRPWIGWRPPGGEAGFDALYERWRDLVEDEAGWRERAPGYDPGRRPRPEALEAAADVLDRRGLGRLLASVTGRAGEGRAVADALRIAEPEPADALRELAAHLRAREAFEADRAPAHLLGPVWAGLATPFPTLRTVIGARALLVRKLADEPEGAAALDGLTALQPAEIGALAGLAPAGRSLLPRLEEAPEALRALPPAEAVAELRRRGETARALLAADPGRVLAPYPVALDRLGGLAELERRRRALLARTAADPHRNLLAALAPDRPGLDRLDAWLAWIGDVRALPLPAAAAAALASPDGAAFLSRMRILGASAGEALAGWRGALARLEAEHGVSGLAASEDLAVLAAFHDALLAHRGELRDAVEIRAGAEELAGLGLGPWLERAEALALPPGDLAPVLAALLVRRKAERLRADPALARASGAALDALRRAFAEQDRVKLAADRAALREALLRRRPEPGFDRGPRKAWTEMALLRAEFGKQRAHAPVRALLARAPLSIQALAPCFMMSPLSLAKFLPRGQMTFDLVVIDEASQMRPEDALGGLLRAGQVVVVGDTKQLPPTDFFLRAAGSEGSPEDETLEDVDDESILEGCLRTFRGVRGLKWHYRSRCESLIAFSNRHFYGSGLVTFPQARPGSFSVDLVRVDGAYQARRNPAEAQRIAEEAANLMRLHADDAEESLPTLGLVAVNTEQRDLIFEELRRLQSGDPEIERYREKAARRGEDLFVKNLENVQGDERDVILISLTYGPPPGGQGVAQRFGPINSRQGHRRLNVLFSRARRRVVLFASMGSLDVKPAETSARGVHVLKAYLEYAERRSLDPGTQTGREPDSDFEVAVKRRLEDRGFRVDPQVGVSGFRIDLGVRHPDHPDAYLAGIECDGARYHASRSARDRDRLREEVLRGLGWRILRVWSTDWFDDPDGRADRLAGQLEALRAETRDGFARDRAAAEAGGLEDASAGQGAGPPGGEPATGEATIPGTPVQLSLPVDPGDAGRAGTPGLDRARAALEELRRSAIDVEFPGAEPGRSILRPPMIERMLMTRLDRPDDFPAKIPAAMRASTDPRQKKYLDEICAIIGREG